MRGYGGENGKKITKKLKIGISDMLSNRQNIFVFLN